MRIETAMNHGRAISANTPRARHENSRRTGSPVASACGIITSSGSAIASGPFVSAPTAIAAQAGTGRSSKSHRMAAVVQSVSVLSKIAVRAYTSGSRVVA